MLPSSERGGGFIRREGVMPTRRLKVDIDDMEAHMAFKKLGAEGVEVTLGSSTAGEVSGHLRREGDELIFEAEEDDVEGHKRYLDVGEGADVTIRLAEAGDEVKGHIYRLKKTSSSLPFGQRQDRGSRPSASTRSPSRGDRGRTR
jgi:hypothetical protein